VQALSDPAIPRLQLVKPRGEPLGASSNCAVRPLAFRHPILYLRGPASRPLLLHDLPLEVCKRPEERHRARFRSVRVFQPFHPAGVRLLRREFGPLVSLLVPRNPFVRWAPPDSMMMPGLALRSASMCFLAWSAYIWPGPGSSEAIRLMAACAVFLPSTYITTCISARLS